MKKQARRDFRATTSVGAAAALTAAVPALAFTRPDATKPALLGGTPVRSKKFPAWPIWEDQDEAAVVSVLRSGIWSRDTVVTRTEKKYAELMGARYCLLTSNGTQALITALRALNVEGGDEVITSPYTFIATVDAILLNNALPVYVDIDPET